MGVPQIIFRKINPRKEKLQTTVHLRKRFKTKRPTVLNKRRNLKILADLALLQSNTRLYSIEKSLYGLKQASRQWNMKLTETWLASGYTQSRADYSLLTRHSQPYSYMWMTWFFLVVISLKFSVINPCFMKSSASKI